MEVARSWGQDFVSLSYNLSSIHTKSLAECFRSHCSITLRSLLLTFEISIGAVDTPIQNKAKAGSGGMVLNVYPSAR
jgi:hypothetical protein